MTIFIDASALVAVLAREDDWLSLGERILAERAPLWSAMTQWETVAALRLSYDLAPAIARARAAEFAAENNLVLVSIGQRESELAIDAYARYGKGVDPAGLNMGDCFAYACTKANNARLLYKGEDFARTDLA